MADGPPRLISSSALLTAGSLLGAAFGFAFHLVAARGLGPVGYGAFTASLTYVVLWAIVMEGGISVALTREAAANPARLAWTPWLLRWKGYLAITGAVGAVLSAWALGFDHAVVGLVGITALGMIGLSGLRLAFAVFRVIGRFGWEAALSTLQKAALLSLGAAALALGAGPAGVAAAFSTSYALAVAIAVAGARPVVKRAAATPARPPARFFVWTCVPLFAVELLTGVYFRIDQVLLLRLRGAEETGIYGAAYRVAEAGLLFVGGAMTVLFPRLAASARGAPAAFAADFRRAWATLWIVGLVVSVNGWLWAARLFPVLFGRAYSEAATPLAILLAAVPLAYVNYLLTQSLIATGHERYYAFGTAVCAAVNLGLNLVLIPIRGPAGAAAATVATEATLLVLCLGGLGKLARIIPVASTVATGIAAAVVVSAGWYALPGSPLAQAMLAILVSIAAWEIAAPWPLRYVLSGRPPQP